MKERDEYLQAMRPAVAADTDHQPPAALFVHGTLRPVLKLQNPLLMHLFRAHVRQQWPDFARWSYRDQLARVEETMRRHQKLKATLTGTVVGVLTLDEATFYQQHRAEIDRRLTVLLIKRFQDQMHLL